jgi:hypothetical protein
MSAWFWGAFALIIIGIVLCWYVSIRALNSAYSEKWEHGLFWCGTVCITIGIVIMMVIVFYYARQNSQFKKDIIDLNITLRKYQSSGGSSGPGFFSRIGSKIGGWFKKNTSVPAAGNPGEVNPFKNQ